jgi:hypothetical protein
VNPTAAAAEHVLREHPHPALRLSELVELLAGPLDRTLDEAKLRTVLERYPDHFRLLDPWRGYWRTVAREGDGPTRHRDVWVVALEDPDRPPADCGGTALKLRESVRWLGKGMDPRSPGDVTRFYAIALSEREVRAALLKRAA